MTENKRLIQYKVLCDEYEEVARILFEIIESGEQIEGHHQIQEWVNNLYKENNELLRENKRLKSKLEESKKAHSNCDKLWWELHDEKEQLKKENEQLKSIVKEVIELLSEEVDVFSDKATEHDINAYIELNELDNKDAYYMATATKKAIKLLKGVVDD